jgi:CubicO group peptidase (beta-lactamase class C family)
MAGLSRRAFLAATGGMALAPRLARAASRYPHVAALVHAYVDSGKLPGLVAHLGPRATFARGVQTLGDPRPVGIDSLYRAYSMTKPITGMAAMILIDDGKLTLDTPVAAILPRYARMQVQVVPDGSLTEVRPARTAITVRHLMTHTAGLGYAFIQKGPISAAYAANGIAPLRIGHKPVPFLATPTPQPSLAAFADALADLPLVYEPGTRWSYSVGLDLLGRVIEVVAGQPFDAFLADRVFGPCGMDSSGFFVAPANAARLTTTYGVFDGRLEPVDPAVSSIYLDPPPFPFGGAGLVTSPRDYDRFLRMLLGQGMLGRTRVMSADAVRTGTSDLLPQAVRGSDIEGSASGFGAGGRVGVGRDAGTFGWSGAAGTVGFVDYRHGLTAGLWGQYMPSHSYPIVDGFSDAVHADVDLRGG